MASHFWWFLPPSSERSDSRETETTFSNQGKSFLDMMARHNLPVSAVTTPPEIRAGFFRFSQADVCGRGAVSERRVVFSDLGACDINRNLFEELFV